MAIIWIELNNEREDELAEVDVSSEIFLAVFTEAYNLQLSANNLLYYEILWELFEIISDRWISSILSSRQDKVQRNVTV